MQIYDNHMQNHERNGDVMRYRDKEKEKVRLEEGRKLKTEQNKEYERSMEEQKKKEEEKVRVQEESEMSHIMKESLEESLKGKGGKGEGVLGCFSVCLLLF